MDQSTQTERLWEIAGRFGVEPKVGLLGVALPPIDVAKPNQHDTKSEFLQEKQAVTLMIDHCRELLFLFIGVEGELPEIAGPRDSIIKMINAKVRDLHKADHPDTIPRFLRKLVTDNGVSSVLPYLLFDVWGVLKERKQELADQEAEFWSDRHRPPNHYARTIALRLARLIAKQTGKRPTIGTARDGGHPSTEYGRALEDVFKLLSIRANVRNAGTWAIGQLTEEDLLPPRNALAGINWDQSPDALRPSVNVLAEITKALQKGASE